MGAATLLPKAVLQVSDDSADLISRNVGQLSCVGSLQLIYWWFSRAHTSSSKKPHLKKSLGLWSGN